jgi:hypothetical protein
MRYTFLSRAATPSRMPGVGQIDILLPRGCIDNEPTKYHYNVIVHVGYNTGIRTRSKMVEQRRSSSRKPSGVGQ